MKTISVRTGKREEMLDITGEVRKVLPEGDGVCVLFVQHTTCGLTVNENADPDVKSDMLGWLKRLVPQFPAADLEENHPVGEPPPPLLRKEGSPNDPGASFFKHYEHNSDAHIKASLMGPSLTVPFSGGELMLGRWQGIYLCEFDGPRERKVVVQIMKAEG